MIILGDIACPNQQISKSISKALTDADLDPNQTILFNLEGLITDNYSAEIDKPILYNHSSVLKVFEKFDTKIAALANNHTLDLPEFLNSTKETLSNNNFLSVGAGKLENSDFKYVVTKEAGYNVYVMNACWDFLLYHQNTTDTLSTVNVIKESYILNWVNKIKSTDLKSKIVIYFHWSFDLETLPFPSYRRFSKALIDAGVSLVVGAHSHCIQGGEKYKEGYIAYGLGNFFIPNDIYANGKLKFPKMSNKGWVIEWDIINNSVQNYWFEYAKNNDEHVLNYVGRDNFLKSKQLIGYSPFDGMSDLEYDKYFKKNRRKKILIPVFYKFESSFSNKLKLSLLIARAKIARFMAEKGLIGWQN